MPLANPIPCSPDYEADFSVWAAAQAEFLRRGEYGALDIPNLIEELEAMVINYRRELRHRLEVLLLHKLKRSYQPLRHSRSWDSTILEQRSQLDSLFEMNPSLRKELPGALPKAYQRAVRRAAVETGIDAARFPPACPFTVEEMLED